jgi:hypothetical protein
MREELLEFIVNCKKDTPLEEMKLVCRDMEELGFVTKAVIAKNIVGNEKAKGKTANLWRYRALSGGFNIFEHEYIMIFQKTKLKKIKQN